MIQVEGFVPNRAQSEVRRAEGVLAGRIIFVRYGVAHLGLERALRGAGEECDYLDFLVPQIGVKKKGLALVSVHIPTVSEDWNNVYRNLRNGRIGKYSNLDRDTWLIERKFFHGVAICITRSAEIHADAYREKNSSFRRQNARLEYQGVTGCMFSEEFYEALGRKRERQEFEDRDLYIKLNLIPKSSGSLD